MALPLFSAIIIAWLLDFLGETHRFIYDRKPFEVDDYGRGEYIVWKNLILPAITLGIRPLAVVIQLTRSSILDTLNEDFIRTAKAKGLSSLESYLYMLYPMHLTCCYFSLGLACVNACRGRFYRVYIWWNGLGKEIVYALNYMDLPVVMGAVLTLSICFVAITILTDLIYYLLDPKLRV